MTTAMSTQEHTVTGTEEPADHAGEDPTTNFGSQPATNEESTLKEGQPQQNPGTKKLSKGQKKRLKQKEKLQKQAAQGKTEQKEQKEGDGQSKEKKESEGVMNLEKLEQSKSEAAQQKPQKAKDKKKKGKSNPAAELARKRLEQQQKFEEEQEKKRLEFEAEQERLRLEEEEKKRKELEEKQRLQKEEKERLKKLKQQGLNMTKKQKEKIERARAQIEKAKQREEKGEEEEEPKAKTEQEVKEDEERRLKQKKKDDKLLKDERNDFISGQGKFRSPVCVILGHVDTGKTTLLDKIRKTNVQEGEAGGITQQIGATFFPKSKLEEEISKCKGIIDVKVDVPGLLIIDTPGHESFGNLRSRGSSLCDVAILVIDLQHGLEPQTLESLEILQKGDTPYVVALNKIDRSYAWTAQKDGCSYLSLKNQKPEAFQDYKTKLDKVIMQLNEKGYNAALYWQNPDPQDYLSLVPTSGITGEGIPDILSMIVYNSINLKKIRKRITIKKDVFKCTVMEVKMIEGYGTTVDCLLVDGQISKEDQIVLLGFDGPIIAKVKALLTPHPMKQMRIKDEYLHHDFIRAANGVKIAANGLDKAVAGSPVIVANSEQEVEDAIAICKNELTDIQKKFKLENLGVGVAASTLGSLEALMAYLKSQKIPVSHISVGPVSREDIIKAMKSILSEIPERRKQEYACLLVFDVKVLADAQKYAEENQIKIFSANIIYHLTDFFTQHVADVKKKRKEKQGKDAVFPCILKQVETFRKKDPIVLGVDVEYGVLKIGTPICVYKEKQKNGDKQIRIGVVESIEHNHKKIPEARKKNGSVAISIGGDPSIMCGRHFDPKDKLVSKLTRQSIDCLKQHFKDEVLKDQWVLIMGLKKYFNIS